MNAHQRRVQKRRAERAFQDFRAAGIPPEQARHWAEARAARSMVEDRYDPERPIFLLWLVRKATVALGFVAVLSAAGIGLGIALAIIVGGK